MDKESFDRIVSVLEDAGMEPQAYSGRCMYGRECLGVQCGNPTGAAFEIMAALAEGASDLDEVKDIASLLSDPSTDQMGKGSIMYWSSITWMGDEEGEDPVVEVCTEEYESEYGKKPRGHGQWHFATDDDSTTFVLNGEFREVRAEAVRKALAVGLDTLYVGT